MRRRDRAEEVTAGRAQPIGHGGDDVLAHLARRPFGDLGHLGSARLAVQHVRVPPLELGVVLGRGSEQVADDRHGQPAGELVDRSTRPRSTSDATSASTFAAMRGSSRPRLAGAKSAWRIFRSSSWRGGSASRKLPGPSRESSMSTPSALENVRQSRPAALNVVEPREHPDRPLAVHVDRRLVPQAAVDRIGVLVEEERVVLNHAATPAGASGRTTARPAPRCGSGRSEARSGSSGRAAGRLPRRRTR